MSDLLLLAAQIFAREGSQPYRVLLENRVYKIVVTDSGKTILVFLGTNSIWQHIDNFRFLALTTQGFPTGWYNAAVNTHNALNDLGIRIDYVIGYSRGGAIALIYSCLYGTPCVAFSSPKVSKKIKHWDTTPMLVFCFDDCIINLPPGFHFPGNFTVLQLNCSGHLWTEKKYSELRSEVSSKKV